jgi:hypothetical protein
MKKTTALTLLGGTESTAARALGCARQSVNQWPDELPRRIADRVIAARVRQEWAQGLQAGHVPAKLPELIADAIN